MNLLETRGTELNTTHYKAYKHILSSTGGMNLFRGCQHGCIYCDSRSACYRMDHDFEDIEVKTNASKILESELRAKRKRHMISTGAMTDPYIPLEADLKITRRCIELIGQYGFGLATQTKSTLILRDLDLLEDIHRNSKCVVQLTLTTLDEELCKIVEPNVSTTAERIHAMNAIRARGIPVVVWLTPILPFINDTEENLDGLLKHCADAGVYGVISFGMGLTLREGDREYYYAMLDRHFPGLRQIYQKKYGLSYEIQSDNSDRLKRRLIDTCEKRGMVCDDRKIFEYLRKFEDKQKQLSLW